MSDPERRGPSKDMQDGADLILAAVSHLDLPMRMSALVEAAARTLAFLPTEMREEAVEMFAVHVDNLYTSLVRERDVQ